MQTLLSGAQHLESTEEGILGTQTLGDTLTPMGLASDFQNANGFCPRSMEE